MSGKTYRPLTADEVQQLIRQNCSSTDWNLIRVTDKFKASNVANSYFSGDVLIGNNHKTIQLYGGVERNCGIYNSTIHNSTIGDCCFINFVKNRIANYKVGDNTIIDNVDIIATEGDQSFGNGLKVDTIDETGHRTVRLYDFMSAHIAYIMVLYRHRPHLIEKLESIIEKYAQSKTKSIGEIGSHCVISNAHVIKNTNVGDYARIDGATALVNGTLVSNKQAPTFIGNTVNLDGFIVLSGSKIAKGAMLENCFIGQGCEMAKGYSAENSLFFANCQGFHGEACSIFAGPYTVTHHKSTLLIASMFSFMNAGSGSNQSNHMYKLGPIHQGIAERGARTASDSYILWPAKVGPFTLVMGRHYKNSDTSDMPFSYLIENEDNSWLTPGVNLRSVGTIRDAMKWPRRDKRTDPLKNDKINYNILSPVTIEKMENGIKILKDLQKVSGPKSEEYIYNNTLISKNSLNRGIDLYNIGITKFLGNSVITRLNNGVYKTISDIRTKLKADSSRGTGAWVDLSGLIVPKSQIERLINDIESGKISSLESIEDTFDQLHREYYELEWDWSADLLERQLGKTIEELEIEDLIQLVEHWRTCVLDLDHMLYEDARKEFTLSAMTGYGADGGTETKKKDFEAVRGDFENNPTVLEILSHIERKTALADRVIQMLQSIG